MAKIQASQRLTKICLNDSFNLRSIDNLSGNDAEPVRKLLKQGKASPHKSQKLSLKVSKKGVGNFNATLSKPRLDRETGTQLATLKLNSRDKDDSSRASYLIERDATYPETELSKKNRSNPLAQINHILDSIFRAGKKIKTVESKNDHWKEIRGIKANKAKKPVKKAVKTRRKLVHWEKFRGLNIGHFQKRFSALSKILKKGTVSDLKESKNETKFKIQYGSKKNKLEIEVRISDPRDREELKTASMEMVFKGRNGKPRIQNFMVTSENAAKKRKNLQPVLSTIHAALTSLVSKLETS